MFVKSTDFQEEKYFRLQKSTVVIEEVVISRLKLTGNLAKDSKSLDKEDVNAKIQNHWEQKPLKNKCEAFLVLQESVLIWHHCLLERRKKSKNNGWKNMNNSKITPHG